MIYGLLTPKIFINLNKSHYIHFMHLNTFFFWEGFRSFPQILKGLHGTKIV